MPPSKKKAPPKRFIVDGGYISWIYGTSHERLNSWTTKGRPSFSRAQGGVILMDSPTSKRRAFTATYKQKRVTRKSEDPEWIEKTRMVNAFKDEYLWPDPTLALMAWDGLEADDLIGIMISQLMIKPPLKVIGVDKDLLQLGDYSTLRMGRVTGEPMTIDQYASRLPKGVQAQIRTPEAVLLSLVLMGDKSDSITRLIPPRELGVFNEIMDSASPWKAAHRRFGEEFLTNLYLAVLPGPFCYKIQPSPKAVYRSLVNGRPTYRLFDEIEPTILESMREVLAVKPPRSC